MQYKIHWRANHEFRVLIKLRHHAVTMAITNFVWPESDRAIHKELNDIKFYGI